MFNSKKTSITIVTSKPTYLVFNKDTLKELSAIKSFNLNRDKQPIKIVAFNESTSKTVSIKSKNSFAYWLNLYPNWHFWTGFYVDTKTKKRYTYPKTVYIDMDDKDSSYLTYRRLKDTIIKKFPFFSIDIHSPYVNLFHFHPVGERSKTKVGFMGLGAGLNIHFNNFFNIDIIARYVFDAPIPFPAAYDQFSGERWILNSKYITVINNHLVKNFSLGYGIFVGENHWRYRYLGSADTSIKIPRKYVDKKYTVLGPSFNFKYKPKKSFYMALTYRPSFVLLNFINVNRLEHLLNLAFGWNIQLKKS